jgi:hypothetical protein
MMALLVAKDKMNGKQSMLLANLDTVRHLTSSVLQREHAEHGLLVDQLQRKNNESLD